MPEAEGWTDWIDWYEDRLTGRRYDSEREFARVTASGTKRTPGSGEDGERPGERVDEQYANTPARERGGQNEADQDNRNLSGDEPDSQLTTSEFRRLPSQEQVARMVRWFRRMYEDPVNQTPYDCEDGKFVYVWGGPFEARDELWDQFGGIVSDKALVAAVSEIERNGTIEWAPTDWNPKHPGGPDENEEDPHEPVPPTLDDIQERLARGMTPTFGDPLETQNRQVLRAEIARLLDAIESEPPRHGGIGHNRPPESLSLSLELIVEVKEAADALDTETAKPAPSVDAVVESTGRLEKVLGPVRRKLELSVDSFMKTLGNLAAGVVVVGLTGVLWVHIASVYRVALEWLDAVLPLF